MDTLAFSCSENTAALWDKVSRLAWKIVNKYAGLCEAEDLYQEAFLGFLKAAELFDDDMCIQFSTYCYKCMERHIQRYINKNRYGSSYSAKKAAQIRKYKADYYKENGKAPTMRNVCVKFSITTEELFSLEALSAEPISLNTPLKEEAEATIEDTIASAEDSIGDADRRTDHEPMAAALWDMIRDSGHYEVMSLEYKQGLNSGQIAEALSMTPQQVRQDKAKCMKHLRKKENREKLRPYYNEYMKGLYNRGRLSYFKHSGMSEPESIALRLYGEMTRQQL